MLSFYAEFISASKKMIITKSKNSIFFRAATFVILIKHLPAVCYLFNLSRLKTRQDKKDFHFHQGYKERSLFH
jgi:hypothetical protein